MDVSLGDPGRNARCRNHRISRIAVIALCALGVSGGGGVVDAAYYDNFIEPSSLVLTLGPDAGTSLDQYEWVELTGNWSVPSGIAVHDGDTFGMTLPVEFVGTGSMNFPMTDPTDPSIVYANCVLSPVQPSEMTCTMTDAVEGKENIAGNFAVWLIADDTTTSSNVTFVVGSNPVVVVLPGQTNPACPGICPFEFGPAPTEPQKFGAQTGDRLYWRIDIPGTDGGFTVNDTLTTSNPAFPHTLDAATTRVYRLLKSEWATQNFEIAPGSPGTVSILPDGFALSYPASAAYSYRVTYESVIAAGTPAGVVANNSALVNGVEYAYGVILTQGGNGTGSGVTTTTAPPTTTTTTPVGSTTTTTTTPVGSTTTTTTTTTMVSNNATTTTAASSAGPGVTTTTGPVTTLTFGPSHSPLPSTGNQVAGALAMATVVAALGVVAILASRRRFF